MPGPIPVRIVRELAARGFNADREAVTLLARAEDVDRAVEAVVAEAPDDALRITPDLVRRTADLTTGSRGAGSTDNSTPSNDSPDETTGSVAGQHARTAQWDRAATSGRTDPSDRSDRQRRSGRRGGGGDAAGGAATGGDAARDVGVSDRSAAPEAVVENDVTGRSTGTGEYADFVSVFRDRYERLASMLRPRVNHRPTAALERLGGGTDAAIVGMVADVRSTKSGHWLVELEDTAGTFPCLILKDRSVASVVDELLLDEVIAVEGTLADDGGVLFVDAVHFPDIPRTYEPSTADRHVQAALVSDVHVGSQEFLADAWSRFADWLHTDEAAAVEYLLIAGDMVEGVGVYPGQDEELDVVDIYEQYAAFSEHLKDVPGDLEIVMIPGNHDAVRLAEPQPGLDEELRELVRVHDARIVGNPVTVTVEGVSILMYHGVSLDEVIAELPASKASYDEPHAAMSHLLKKRHLAPQFGERTRVAPEERDYLVVDEVPDVFHAGHVHKLGYGRYHGVTVINSGCWQAQTAFQRSVNIDPDAGYAPIVDLDTLDVTIRKFA